jgi:hypothetical protein
MEVVVEILDLTDDEARVLLLSIDPLAALAETQDQLRQRLLELAPPFRPISRPPGSKAPRKPSKSPPIRRHPAPLPCPTSTWS